MSEQVANVPQSVLVGAILAGDTSLVVQSATLFSTTGYFRIKVDAELIGVATVAGTTFSALDRGIESTTAADHANGATVTQVLTAAGLLALIAQGAGGGGFPTFTNYFSTDANIDLSTEHTHNVVATIGAQTASRTILLPNPPYAGSQMVLVYSDGTTYPIVLDGQCTSILSKGSSGFNEFFTVLPGGSIGLIYDPDVGAWLVQWVYPPQVSAIKGQTTTVTGGGATVSASGGGTFAVFLGPATLAPTGTTLMVTARTVGAVTPACYRLIPFLEYSTDGGVSYTEFLTSRGSGIPSDGSYVAGGLDVSIDLTGWLTGLTPGTPVYVRMQVGAYGASGAFSSAVGDGTTANVLTITDFG